MQLQASSFFERLTAREQIRTWASLYGVGPKQADAMLATVGLADKADTPVEKLSGGQAQRLSIACALAHGPDLVFLDEPTSGLDPQARRNLWDLLRDINGQGHTVVLTTHYLDEAEILCDRVAIMDLGKILRDRSAGRARPRAGRGDPDLRREWSDRRRRDARGLFADADVTDDGVSLTIATRTPAGRALDARRAQRPARPRGARARRSRTSS